eukprot:TRINITY_DN18117_c0_g1_i1.p1 TRINITY_DN18117_c0_g1~~TRINITY_DN18117_c0_g1_i1.p1  ORF type:complete len:103 (-),score=20.71 TRINITY_DN18117_c0_g1_i1:474-782(-)
MLITLKGPSLKNLLNRNNMLEAMMMTQTTQNLRAKVNYDRFTKTHRAQDSVKDPELEQAWEPDPSSTNMFKTQVEIKPSAVFLSRDRESRHQRKVSKSISLT